MFNEGSYRATVHTILGEFGLAGCSRISRLGGTATPKFDVETHDGRFVARVRPEEFSGESFLHFDHEILRRLADRGLPVPRPRRRPDGTTWLRLGGYTIEVLSWVEGVPFSWDDLEAVRNVGRFLARFHGVLTGDFPPGKEAFLREDHPDLLTPYVEEIRSRCRTPADRALVARIGDEIASVRTEYDGKLRPQLPMAVIHGDIHTGNLMFRGSEVAAVYDFDYLSVEARMRDVCDALMFFAALRDRPADPDDITSLVQPFRLDFQRSRILLDGYQEVSYLRPEEWQAAAWILRSQWCQIRLRGSRKVSEERKAPFVLNRFFEVIDWLEEEAESFFDRLARESADEPARCTAKSGPGGQP